MVDPPGTPFPHYGEEQAAQSRRKRRVRILNLVLLLATAAPFVGWFALDRIATRRLERTLDRIHRAGYAVDPRELMPAEVASLDNAAPLYEAAFGLIRDARSELIEVPGGMESMVGDTEDTPRILQILGRYQEAFDLARRARRKPYCRFDRDYARGPEERRPEWLPLDTLSWGLRRRAEAQAAEGRASEARETVRDLWALALAFRDEPMGWSQWASRVLCQRAIEATAFCSRESVTEDDWREWRDLLPDPASFRKPAFLGFRGEIGFWAKDARDGHPVGSAGLFGTRSRIDRLMGAVCRPLLTLGASEGLARFQRSLAQWESRPEPTREDLLRPEDPFYLGWFRVSLIHLHSYPLYVTRRRVTVLQAAIAVARAGMDCERFWMAEGRYPEAIAEKDPMTGGPLEFSLDRSSLRSLPPQGPWGFASRAEDDGLVWDLLHVAD